MARAHRVEKSRKVRRCHAGHDIEIGQPYYWANPGFRSRAKKYACTAHPFKPSQLTNGLVSEALSAAENFEATLEGIDAAESDALDQVTSAVEDFAGEIEGYVDQRRESFEAWENGNSQLEELYETANAALEEIQNWTADDWAGDEEARDDEDHEDHEEALADWTEHVEAVIESARELAGLEF